MNTTTIGQYGEQAAVEYLDREGMSILQRNWRTKWCEVDIVAQDKTGTIHLVEVRYRRDDRSGGGLESITMAKQRQLIHAAQRWMMQYDAPAGIQIDALAVTGSSGNWSIDYVPNAVEAAG